jgi:hypothetical protein
VFLGAAIALAALLARPRSPKLAGVAGWLGIVSGSAMVALVGVDSALRAAVDADRAASVKMLENMNSPQFQAFVFIALLGGLVATLCLGMALWRARAIPRWAAGALIAYEPANVLTAGGTSPALFAAANALLLVGFAACAVTIARHGFPGPVDGAAGRGPGDTGLPSLTDATPAATR